MTAIKGPEDPILLVNVCNRLTQQQEQLDWASLLPDAGDPNSHFFESKFTKFTHKNLKFTPYSHFFCDCLEVLQTKFGTIFQWNCIMYAYQRLFSLCFTKKINGFIKRYKTIYSSSEYTFIFNLENFIFPLKLYYMVADCPCFQNWSDSQYSIDENKIKIKEFQASTAAPVATQLFSVLWLCEPVAQKIEI
jgi:hypothetical protein